MYIAQPNGGVPRCCDYRRHNDCRRWRGKYNWTQSAVNSYSPLISVSTTHTEWQVGTRNKWLSSCADVVFVLFKSIPTHDTTLQWRHIGRDSVSYHQPHECLLNHSFRRRSKKTSKLRVTGLCAGNSPVTGEFPAQMASNAENVSIWWRHHKMIMHNISLNSNKTHNNLTSMFGLHSNFISISSHGSPFPCNSHTPKFTDFKQIAVGSQEGMYGF